MPLCHAAGPHLFIAVCVCQPQLSSVRLLSHVRLFATPWTVACQASLSITNSRSLLKLMPIESVDSTCKWYHDICLSVWLPSLGVIISTSIHVVARGIISFFLAEYYSVVYMYHIIFTCSSTDDIYVTPMSWLLCLVLQGTVVHVSF